jgi:hypothetical protein
MTNFEMQFSKNALICLLVLCCLVLCTSSFLICNRLVPQANMEAGTTIPLEKRSVTLIKGTIKLYAQKKCNFFLGMTDTTLAVTETTCYNDEILGLVPTGFASFKFERTVDDSCKQDPNDSKTLILSAFSTSECLGYSRVAEWGMNKDDNQTPCLDVEGDAAALAFSFKRA